MKKKEFELSAQAKVRIDHYEKERAKQKQEDDDETCETCLWKDDMDIGSPCRLCKIVRGCYTHWEEKNDD